MCVFRPRERYASRAVFVPAVRTGVGGFFKTGRRSKSREIAVWRFPGSGSGVFVEMDHKLEGTNQPFTECSRGRLLVSRLELSEIRLDRCHRYFLENWRWYLFHFVFVLSIFLPPYRSNFPFLLFLLLNFAAGNFINWRSADREEAARR